MVIIGMMVGRTIVGRIDKVKVFTVPIINPYLCSFYSNQYKLNDGTKMVLNCKYTILLLLQNTVFQYIIKLHIL